MINKLRAILAIGLLLALGVVSMPALALGLGQLNVLSQPGQPLLAEIPIVTSDPSELDNLQARLASPETFRRIGLQPPEGIVSDLQFRVALDVRGNPVIRVTSDAPVQQPLLTFLVEVDWGQGRLVREYSALLDAPRTVSAPLQAPIQAPVAPPSNAIVRPAQPPPAPVAAAEPEPGAETPPTEAMPAAPPETTAEAPPPGSPDAIAVAPPPAPAPTPAVDAESRPGEYGPVQAGETLGVIAQRLRPQGSTLDQTMVALLRANPDAFIDDNINLVRQGAVLRMPDSEALAQTSVAAARAIVREQISQWRRMRQPAPRPEAVAGEAQEAAASSDAATAATGGTPRVADARLEITPPSQGGGQRAGTRSGIAAGGEGDMLRQQMQQTQETLAARNAEVEELKARVAELEQLQQQQQQLISLKDSELAAAQQRLANSNQQAAEAGTTTPAQAASSAPETGGVGWLWPGLGLALILAGIGGWLLMRRTPSPARGRAFDTSALAAGMARTSTAVDPVADVDVDDDATRGAPGDGLATDVVAEGSDAGPDDMEATDPSAPSAWTPPPAGSVEMAAPTWHSGTRPAESLDDAGSSGAPSQPASMEASPAGQDRIELARAYIDLGDTATARSLLQEVADGSDAGAGDEARRLLREMG